uniref:Immunoglobulin V-set domain-containing protein n=1 Tax=Anas zonorhyncha TaxID=75864 RepID=A0A8B9V0Q9_9AVES
MVPDGVGTCLLPLRGTAHTQRPPGWPLGWELHALMYGCSCSHSQPLLSSSASSCHMPRSLDLPVFLKTPEWMFYILTGTTAVDESFQSRTYTIERVAKQKICTLIIKSIVPDDTATYYCAYWYSHYSRNPAITSTNTPSVVRQGTACKDFFSGKGLISMLLFLEITQYVVLELLKENQTVNQNTKL